MRSSNMLSITILLPVLAAAIPQGPKSSTVTPSSSIAPAGPYQVNMPTQVMDLSPEDHAAINDFVSNLTTHLDTLAVDKRIALPALSGIVKYIPSVILPTIFNMAYDMVKDIVGKIDGGDDSSSGSSAPATNATIAARNEQLTRELNAALEARGLGSLASSVRLPSVNLKPILTWLPALIPALIGPAFTIAQEIASHIAHHGDSSTSSAAASTTATIAAATTVPALTSSAQAASVIGNATADSGLPTITPPPVRRDGAIDYASLMSDIQSMIVADPGMLRVPDSPEQVSSRIHTLVSPGLASAMNSAVPAPSA